MSRAVRTPDDLPVSRTVAAHITAMRAARGWSQRTLAKHTENGVKAVGFATICRIEKAATADAPTVAVCVDDLVSLAAAFGVAPERMLTAPSCFACMDNPPRGFACRTCGAAA